MRHKPLLIAVMGPTACGKTELAEALASDLDAELVSADAFQIYRGMDVGTAKPSSKSRYELIDIRDPDEEFSVGEFAQLACGVLGDAWSRKKSVVVVGGTGLYIRALFESYTDLRSPPSHEARQELRRRFALEGLSALVSELSMIHPESAASIDLKNPTRVMRALERATGTTEAIGIHLPPFVKLKLAIEHPSEWLIERIQARVVGMMQNGWVEETRRLLDSGFGESAPGFRALGYKAVARFVRGEIGLEEAAATAIAETRRYAKRQKTWLHSEPNVTKLAADCRLPIEEARQLARRIF